jgi:hypothetical protein
MPFVKYRGGRPPANPKEHVYYRNRETLCYEGLAKLSADARLSAEEKHKEPAERVRAISRFIDAHEYPGLQYVGGACFVDSPDLRSVDEAITEAEYRRLRDEILKANENHWANAREELSKANDPFHRAEATHEHLGWRTRVWVTSYTKMQHHTPYALAREAVAYLRVRQQDASGLTAQLIDIYHASQGGIENALLEGTDWAAVLVDMLAFTGYGPAYAAEIVSTTIPYCHAETEFELATFGMSIRNDSVEVTPDDFTSASLDDASSVTLRHIGDGLSASLPTDAFAAFWNALERQADETARVSGLQRVVRCQSCGAGRIVGPDLKRAFEAMYDDVELSPSLFDEHRSTRSVIQHGARLRTTAYMDEVYRGVSQLQVAAVVAAAKKIGVKPATGIYLSASWPIVVFRCVTQWDGTTRVDFSRLKLPSAANILPQRACGSAERTPEGGVDLPPKVDPLALPPVHK